jgi:succinate dehydrogenase / fumarate reductase, flavoprotein subunit
MTLLYFTKVDTKMKCIKSDVLIIGSGGAGLRAAIELHDSKVDVLVVGKCKKREAHTIMATGGINAAFSNMDKKDNWKIHAADTIMDGNYINDPDAVKLLCKNAVRAVKELERWGCKFHKEKDGKITQRFFGAATYRRACFVGDETGKAILNTLVDQTEKRKIRFKDQVYIFSLLRKNGKVNGALGLDVLSGKILVFNAKIVVLATGGHSRVYRRSSSRFWENNGDGIYLAYRLRAKFMDMEMFQFHPTGMLYPAEADGLLVTEATRGEGAVLINLEGERFMRKYDSKRMELSARDIVARANYTEVKQGRGTKRGGVWLDISHKSKKYILERLPLVYKQFKKYAKIDISKEKMEVAPTAHYSMGGLLVGHKTGKTTVSKLFAVGEVTSGVHGANRLGGNSLAEIMVFGRLIGRSIVKELKKTKMLTLDQVMINNEIQKFSNLFQCKKGKDPIRVKQDLQRLMWGKVGVVRNARLMRGALAQLKKYKEIQLNVSGKLNDKLIAALDIQNMLPVCEMIIKSALFRKESRGAHYRSDCPKLSNKWRCNIVCVPQKGEIKLYVKKIKVVPSEIKTYINKKKVIVKLLE